MSGPSTMAEEHEIGDDLSAYIFLEEGFVILVGGDLDHTLRLSLETVERLSQAIKQKISKEKHGRGSLLR